MKAAVLVGKSKFEIQEVDRPEIREDQIRIKVLSASLCGSDLRTYHHGHPKVTLPYIIGHEYVGVIDSIKDKTNTFKVGDVVTIHPAISCGKCEYCSEGDHNMCENRRVLGIAMPGAFAEYVNVPIEVIERGTIIKVPDDVDPAVATLSEPFVAVLNAHELLETTVGDDVVVLGAGPIGMFHCMLARNRGANRVVLADISQEKLKLVAKRGVADEYVYIESEEKLIEEIMEITKGKGASVVVVANTSPISAQQAVKVAAKFGRVMLFAGFPKANPNLGLDGNLIHYRQINVMGAYGSTPSQYQKAAQLLFQGKIDATNLITHHLPLEKINEGFDLMTSGEALKVVLDIGNRED
ncbi:alcohol dehydrogenase catalytic domain-containing protein [Erysipelothrix sp. HDW6A]|uniref:alcohol dehydrogenase catalytic domain-containing protein n=1 Tax=Erysipelothrix sp. HDW6A TaxID=2714928 RepID=UPI00140B4CB9|nr:alcohol dehydrogenase catalytic domain-containing protein [Erysipelothrix sp. HDW6A]QIK56918.1 alcohol dehydrogenase catalytic domain-containing protein [Erysipelothrix sp. HDW6A]